MKKSSNKGFTLVELIIVIAILAIIMLIAIPNFSGIQQRMQVRADKSTAAQIGKAVRVWFTDFTTDTGMLTAQNATDDHTAGNTYAPSATPGGTPEYDAVPVMTKASGSTTVSPIVYDKLVSIDEYISRGQKPSSLKPSNVTDSTQEYCVFFTAGATDTASKIAVAITGVAADADGVGNEVAISLDTDNKVIDNYDGTAAGVAYIEP